MKLATRVAASAILVAGALDAGAQTRRTSMSLTAFRSDEEIAEAIGPLAKEIQRRADDLRRENARRWASIPPCAASVTTGV
jgi:hypothetical protein